MNKEAVKQLESRSLLYLDSNDFVMNTMNTAPWVLKNKLGSEWVIFWRWLEQGNFQWGYQRRHGQASSRTGATEGRPGDVVMAHTAHNFHHQIQGLRTAGTASTLGRWGKNKRASTSLRQPGKWARSVQPWWCCCQQDIHGVCRTPKKLPLREGESPAPQMQQQALNRWWVSCQRGPTCSYLGKQIACSCGYRVCP